MKIVCGKCSAEVELPREGQSPEIKCPSCGARFRMPSLAEGEEFPHPDTFPGYRIRAIVGHGGMGTVYRATQLSMDREVAIKVLLRKYAHVPRFVARFEREAAALAALSHPNVVGVIDRGRLADTYYFVMEYVHGRTLRHYIKNRRLGIDRALEVAIQICDALDAAHACGIVHRDIKPGNVLIQDDGRAKVADFGIVHMVEEDSGGGQTWRSRLGTARYMAPEQRGTGEPVDARADIFALGVTLHEMLTGALPNGAPASEANSLIPRAVDAIIERATREKREERFQSAGEMREALRIALESMRLDQTPATLTAMAPPLPTLTCHACREAVDATAPSCPKCGAALTERCYRDDCDGVNPVGAERCGRCGGHVELLRRQRRTELEAHLAHAARCAADRKAAEAAAHYQVVAGDPHAQFEALRARAREALQVLRQRRLARLARGLGKAAVVLVILGTIGGATWWTVAVGVPRLESRYIGEIGAPATKTPAGAPPATSTAVEPRPRKRPRQREPLADYLVALSEPAWPRREPRVRLLAASDAALCAASGSGAGKAARDLAATLAILKDGTLAPPGDDQLYGAVAKALEVIFRSLERELAVWPQLAAQVAAVRDQHLKALRAARIDLERVELAAAAIYGLMAVAETGLHGKLDLSSRLVLLDASLVPTTPQPELRLAGDQLAWAGRLLLRYLRGRDGTLALSELLEGARRALDRADREPADLPRLADALEALVQIFAARTWKNG